MIFFDIIITLIVVIMALTIYKQPNVTSEAYTVYLMQLNFQFTWIIILMTGSVIYDKIKDN